MTNNNYDGGNPPRIERLTTETDPVPAVQQPIPPIIIQQMQEPIRTSRDRAQYVRQQKGHSLILHLLLGVFVLWIPAIYFTVSPNHYWHA